MWTVFIGIILILIGLLIFTRRRQPATGGPQSQGAMAISLLSSPAVGVLAVLVGLLFLASTSFIFISTGKVGQLNRIYGDDLPPGRIIALPLAGLNGSISRRSPRASWPRPMCWGRTGWPCCRLWKRYLARWSASPIWWR